MAQLECQDNGSTFMGKGLYAASLFFLSFLLTKNKIGMYIYDNSGNKVKMIPKRYEEIPDVGAYIEDLEHMRLSDEERELLDRILLGIRLEKFTDKLKENYIYRDRIGNAYPEKAVKVTKRDGASYHVVRYSNKMEFKCDASLLSQLPIENERRLY